MGVKATVDITMNRKELGKVKRRTAGLKNAHVDVGFFGAKPHPTNLDEGLTIAVVASINEFGLGVPERAFMRLTMFSKKQKIKAEMVKGVKNVFHAKQTSHQLMKKLGRTVRDAMKLEIALFDSPPNSPDTIAKKGFNAPLVETGTLIGDVDLRVNK